LHVVGHRHVVVPLDAGHVAAPGAEGLAVLDAGLGQGHAFGVVEAAEQALGQGIAAEGTEHAEDVRLGDVLRFVGAEHAHRQHAGGDQQFFRGVGAHRCHHLAAGARLPVTGVVVALLIPVLELVEQSISHCCLLCCPSAARVAANRCLLDKSGTIVPCLNHTAQLDEVWPSKITHVNSVMKYCAAVLSISGLSYCFTLFLDVFKVNKKMLK
jgi:hypothetical protein